MIRFFLPGLSRDGHSCDVVNVWFFGLENRVTARRGEMIKRRRLRADSIGRKQPRERGWLDAWFHKPLWRQEGIVLRSREQEGPPKC